MPILGIDEVGRGPLAGPLVIGAVILPNDTREWFSELADSKKLTAKKREYLNQIILKEAATGLGWVPAPELDQIGISKALSLATRRAVKSVQRLHAPFSQIIIDGKVNFLAQTPLANYVTTCIKADAKFKAVSAASIIAKVAHDQYMAKISPKYPEYQFEKHVGYGTKAHVAAIYKYGLTPEHRKSFEPCKTLSKFTLTPTQHKNTTKKGHDAEQAVANFLENSGHTIIVQNHKTSFYEIDIISTKGNQIFFTEVKYRESSIHGNGLEAITPAKLKQMHFAAESYLKYANSNFKNHSPLLAVTAVSGKQFDNITWFPLVD